MSLYAILVAIRPVTDQTIKTWGGQIQDVHTPSVRLFLELKILMYVLVIDIIVSELQWGIACPSLE